MAIDDPLDATLKQIEADERSLPAEWVEKLVKLTGKLPPPGSEIAAYLERMASNKREENRGYLLDTLAGEVRYAIQKVGDLSKEHLDFVREELPGLVLEANERAAETRSKAKIQRLAKIVGFALEVGPASSVEIADEMLRIATELSERDVKILVDLDAQNQVIGTKLGTPNVNDANAVWKALQSRDPFYGRADVYSACATLQGFGLVIAVERNQNLLDLESVPHALLPKGRAFLEYVRYS
jgi:hypothetical protein